MNHWLESCGNQEYPKCWLCKGSIIGDLTTLTVECEEPEGKPCPEKDVTVHFGCYMDIDA